MHCLWAFGRARLFICFRQFTICDAVGNDYLSVLICVNHDSFGLLAHYLRRCVCMYT